MAFPAKYRSRQCAACERSIEVGEMIEVRRGEKPRHADCVGSPMDEAATRSTVAYVKTMAEWLRLHPEPTASTFAVKHGAPAPDLSDCLTDEERRHVLRSHLERAEAWLKRKPKLLAEFRLEAETWEKQRALAEQRAQRSHHGTSHR